MPWMCCTARATNRNLKNEIVRPRLSREARYLDPRIVNRCEIFYDG